MGLSGLKVLSTRESLGADHLQQLLVERGASVQVIPTIKLLPPVSWAEFDQAASELVSYDWLLFTSINGVIQTANRLAELGVSLPSHLKIAVVGAKTALEVQRAGWTVSFVPVDFQAEGLIEGFEQMDLKGRKFFFPRAQVAREFLPQKLGQFGASVKVIPVYRNLPALENRLLLQACLQKQDLDWVTFTSASTAKNFKLILGALPLHLPKLASIGKITTQAMCELGLTPTLTATKQTLDGLVEAIEDYETKHHPV